MKKINKTTIKKMLKERLDVMYAHIWKDDESEYYICTAVDRFGCAHKIIINVDMRYAYIQMLSDVLVLDKHDISDMIFD